MGFSRALPLALGALAVSSGLAVLTFDIIFAATLSRDTSPVKVNVVAITASVLGSVTIALLLLLLRRQVWYRNGAHIQNFGHGKQHTYLLAALGGGCGVLSAILTAVLLGIMQNRSADLPKRVMGSMTSSLVIAAFVLWAVSLLSQVIFVLCMVIIHHKDFQQQIQCYRADSEPQEFPEIKEQTQPRASSNRDNADQGSSVESKSPTSSRGRSRAGSDTVSSLRSSLSQVVRPISSKTKLIHNSHKSPYRPSSVDSGYRDTNVSVEDGFDSWDTSAVDAESWQAVASASPTPPRFLETIPASPTTSRSPSPGFPLDLEPPKGRQRSRSYSPANSNRDVPRASREKSPTGSTRDEAHIHPLFRSDSPTPPPATTPNTIVTAAPNAGQVISDRQSIRSIHRMRSGSLPSSPLMHNESLDSIRNTMERQELERLAEGDGERTLTPPIPDFILNGGPRSSMQGYNSRRKPGQAGLEKVGEVGER